MLSAQKNFFAPLLLLLLFSACKPVIHSFQASPNPVVSRQNVHLDWNVSGTPSLEFNEHRSVDSVDLLEFTLVVKKGGKEARQTIQVQKLKDVDTIVVAFTTSKRVGDTVIASGTNNTNLWGRFAVRSVISASMRELAVTHEGRAAVLTADGTASTELKGTSAGGEWTLKTLLTPEEKADNTRIPEQLRIKAVIHPLN